MDDPVIESQLHEYDQLTSHMLRLTMAQNQIMPLFLTLGGALLVIYRANVGEFFPFVVLFGLFLFTLWIGFVHGTYNRIGLSLVELELKINNQLSVSSEKGLVFYTDYIAQGWKTIPGYLCRFILLLVFLAGAGLLVFFQAAIKYVSCEWCFSQKAIRFGALIISLNLNMVALITFAWTEIKTLKRKKEIINKYSQREPGSK
jgi:hypothetical protein